MGIVAFCLVEYEIAGTVHRFEVSFDACCLVGFLLLVSSYVELYALLASHLGDERLKYRLRNEPQKANDMTLEELKKQAQFKDCKSDEEVVARAQHYATLAGKAQTLEDENKELKTKLKGFEDEAEADAEAERKELLDAAEQDGRINAESRPTFEKILKGNMDEGKKVLSALTPKRKVMNDLHVQPGVSDGPWEQRQKQIREARMKRQFQ